MRINGSKFASFCFLLFPFYFHESGLFNGLQANEMKKFARFPISRLSCGLGHFKQPQPLLARSRVGRADSDNMNNMDVVSDFVKKKIGSYSDACWFVCPRSVPDVMAVPGP